MKKGFKAAMGFAVVIALLISGMAVSLAITTTIQFKAGPFTISHLSVSPFNGESAIGLTGQDQILEASINDFTIVDARGNNKGWIVRISATPFADAAGNRLHEGALSISNVSVVQNGNSDPFDGECTIANNTRITSVPQNLITVPESRGKGTYTVSGSKLLLEVWPKEVLASTYTSTLTIDLVTNIK